MNGKEIFEAYLNEHPFAGLSHNAEEYKLEARTWVENVAFNFTDNRITDVDLQSFNFLAASHWNKIHPNQSIGGVGPILCKVT